MLLHARDSALLVVDMQAKLVPALADPAATCARVRILMQAAQRLDVPMLLTEQYPQGLGGTVPELRELAPDDAVMAKLDFPATREPAFADRLARLGRSDIVICGAETHVCVLQTAAGVAAAGHRSVVVADACGSRRDTDRAAALERMARHGIEVVTSEMVVFEWLGRAGSDLFRDVSRLIK